MPGKPAPAPRQVKPQEFIVVLDTRNQSLLGLDVDWTDGRTLYVNSVQPGAIQVWNQQRPAEQVRSGDRIIAVNGYAGDPVAMASLCRELLGAQQRLQLLVRGPPPPPPLNPKSERR